MSNISPRKRRNRVWLIHSTPEKLSDYFRVCCDWHNMLRAIRCSVSNPESALPPFCDPYEIFQLDLERIGEPGGMIEVTGEAKAAAFHEEKRAEAGKFTVSPEGERLPWRKR